MNLKPKDKLSMTNGCLKVNGRLFIVERPNEPLHEVEENKLVTLFRGHLYNEWRPEEIKGHFV